MLPLTVAEAERGILAADRGVLARAITMIESTREEDRAVADELVERLLPRAGSALRVAVSGAPGVGKSTLLDALGKHVVEACGKRIAVLAVDPSSTRSGGSILGDKTRMSWLSTDPRAYVRPSPTANVLGGVARRTREAMLLCEAFGFDVVVVETVGVGQSETDVASMVDTFVLIALGGAGDELQGIKRGIMELADVIAVNKADGDGVRRARQAARDLTAAVHYLERRVPSWEPRVLMVSGLAKTGIEELWAAIEAHRAKLEEGGALGELRSAQAHAWMWAEIDTRLRAAFRSHPSVVALVATLEADVAAGRMAPPRAAHALTDAFASRVD